MSKLVGYMEGTDPVWLTTLQVQGYDTVPLSNGLDGHGRNIRSTNEENKPDLIVCYLHKLIAPQGEEHAPEELLLPAKLYHIPVLVVCPQEHHDAGAALLGAAAAQVEFIDPSETVRRVLELIN